MELRDYVSSLGRYLSEPELHYYPWAIINNLEDIISRYVAGLDAASYATDANQAIHKSAKIDPTSELKGPILIGPNCFVGPHTLLRSGVILGEGTSIGPACEVKRSIICDDSALGHFNFVGESILGSNVNLEAGAITANYYNERTEKSIYATVAGERINTECEKFGALIGDGCKIGANAVTSPGTILGANTVIARLQLVEQNPLK